MKRNFKDYNEQNFLYLKINKKEQLLIKEIKITINIDNIRPIICRRNEKQRRLSVKFQWIKG